mgnify:CR=1 FL=1
MSAPFHPRLEDEDTQPPDPIAPLLQITDAQFAFPADVNPDPNDVPDKYWRDKKHWIEDRYNPWVKFVGHIVFGSKDVPQLLPREGTDVQKVWRWANACMRSYTLKHEQKLAVVAWILDSYFYAYWFKGSEPQWVIDAQQQEKENEHEPT